MAVEWTSRVNRPFVLRDALALTGVRLAGLVCWSDELTQVEAREATMARRRGGLSGPATEAVLSNQFNPDAVEFMESDVYFEILEWDAAALVSVSQSQQRSEDPETGLFAWVTAERNPASKVLAIAAAIALAESGAGELIDEYGYLSDSRLNSPADVFERLRVKDPQDSLDAAIDAVLAKTRLRGRSSG